MIKPRRHLTAQRVNGSQRNVSSCSCAAVVKKDAEKTTCTSVRRKDDAMENE